MKVLITSGGGAKGAFSVGALKHLQTRISSFDFISGTSTGSLIAAMIAAGKLDVLVNVYRNTTNQDVLKAQNIIDNIRDSKPFLFDTGPLQQQIETQVDDSVFNTIIQSPTILCLNAVCLQTGKTTVFTTKDIVMNQHQYDIITIDNRDLIIKALLGSSNQAVFLPPVKIKTNVNGEIKEWQYADGGNREVIPSRVVVNNLDRNASHEIYVLSNNPHKLDPPKDDLYTDLVKVLIRALVMFIQEGRENDIETLLGFKFQAAIPSNIKIFYIHPNEELDPEFPTGLRFDNFRMKAWIREGESKAEEILTNFPNGNVGLFA